MELFYCDRLGCRLTRGQCAERRVRALKLRRGPDEGWVPESWANLVSCRAPCKTGDKHVRKYKPKDPNRPSLVRSLIPRKRQTDEDPEAPRCTTCGAVLFAGLNDRVCCRKARRRQANADQSHVRRVPTEEEGDDCDAIA